MTAQDEATSPAEAIGKASEALEYVERARGHLYSFHQLMGRADIEFGNACDLLNEAGLHVDADDLDRDIVGRNVLDGRWTYQVVDEFDALYYAVVRQAVVDLVDAHLGGERHALERQMKEQRRTVGLAGHEMEPPNRRDRHAPSENSIAPTPWQVHRVAPVRADADSLFVAADQIPGATVGDVVELDAGDDTDVRLGRIADLTDRDGASFFRLDLDLD
jgi:hypothetical protein